MLGYAAKAAAPAQLFSRIVFSEKMKYNKVLESSEPVDYLFL